MAFLTLEDLFGSMEVIVFPSTFTECSEILSGDEPIVIQGTLKTDDRGMKIIADSVDSLSEARKKFTESAAIRLQADQVSRAKLERLKQVIQEFYGPCPVGLTLHFAHRGEVDIQVPQDMTIRPCSEFQEAITGLIDQTEIIFLQKGIELKQGNGKKRWKSKN